MAGISGSASADIDAPIEAVWAIVADVESAPAWQRGVDATTAIERDADGRATCCETVTDAKVKVFHARVRFDYEPSTRLSWVQERGDLKSMAGSWRLEDLGDGRTRAAYSLRADPGALLSRFIKGALEQRMRAVLIDGRPPELKARAEATAAA
jgi:carbon monoxide dehydrogenase subunit G